MSRSSGRRAGALGTNILGTRTSKPNTVPSTVLKVLLCLLGHGRKSIVTHEPSAGLRRALASGSAGLVAAVAGRHGGVLVGVLQGAEVTEFLDGRAVAGDADETEFLLGGVTFFGIFIHEATRVDRGHLGRVEGGDFFEFTGGFGAAVFGEAGCMIRFVRSKRQPNLQDWHGVVLEVVDFLSPCGGLESRRVTPGVVVEGKEVSTLIVSAAVHVVGSLKTVRVNIGSRVSNRNFAVTTSSNVLLHVTRYGLDPWSSGTSVDAVDVLVSREEQKGVVVLLELIDSGKDVLQVHVVV